MNEHPILMNPAMVRATLAGIKTQTRRTLRVEDGWQIEQPPQLGRITSKHPKQGRYGVFIRKGLGTDFPEADLIPCPYGQPGDRLWVRETWQGPILECDEHYDQWRESPDIFKKPGFCVYRATDTLDAVDDDGNEIGWRPSIHMPRWASRIDLEITGVRVERLQDISREDAIAEGIERVSEAPHWAWKDYTGNGQLLSPVMSFHSLWESINGPGSWDSNPWLWVIEFRRI